MTPAPSRLHQLLNCRWFFAEPLGILCGAVEDRRRLERFVKTGRRGRRSLREQSCALVIGERMKRLNR